MLMPERKYQASSASSYRYGFNGKENDNELKGEGNQQDYGLRIYDARLGRFLSVDPLSEEYPWNSSYAFAENDVVRGIDIEGAEKYIKTNYRNAAGVIYKSTIQSITNIQTGKAVELNFHNATGKLTTYDVYESDLYDNGKVVDIKRDKNYRNKLSSDEIKILNKQKTARSQTEAPRESDPFDNNIFYENYSFQKGVYSSDIFDADKNVEKVGTMKTPIAKPKIPTPNSGTKPLPIKETNTFTKGSNINFWVNTASTQGSVKDEVSDIMSSVNGKSDYSITIFGNANGNPGQTFSDKANIICRVNGYKTYGDLALARANKIKSLLVEKGLDPSKIQTKLGNPEGGWNADYKITTTTIK